LALRGVENLPYLPVPLLDESLVILLKERPDSDAVGGGDARHLLEDPSAVNRWNVLCFPLGAAPYLGDWIVVGIYSDGETQLGARARDSIESGPDASWFERYRLDRPIFAVPGFCHRHRRAVGLGGPTDGET
jgi:hypothetical protein